MIHYMLSPDPVGFNLMLIFTLTCIVAASVAVQAYTASPIKSLAALDAERFMFFCAATAILTFAISWWAPVFTSVLALVVWGPKPQWLAQILERFNRK